MTKEWMLREIQRLRTERDYARREVCWHLAEMCGEPTRLKALSFAIDRGWDCFKDDAVAELCALIVKELYSGEG